MRLEGGVEEERSDSEKQGEMESAGRREGGLYKTRELKYKVRQGMDQWDGVDVACNGSRYTLPYIRTRLLSFSCSLVEPMLCVTRRKGVESGNPPQPTNDAIATISPCHRFRRQHFCFARLRAAFSMLWIARTIFDNLKAA